MDIYRVIDTNDNSVVKAGFAKRKAAKVIRDKKNGEKGTRYIVSRGEDHPRGSSNGITNNTGRRWL